MKQIKPGCADFVQPLLFPLLVVYIYTGDFETIFSPENFQKNYS